MSNVAPTWSDFVAAYPVFDTPEFVTSGPAQLSLSSRLMSRPAWGDFYSDAIILDCAHNLRLNSMAAQSGGRGAIQLAAGPISSVSVAGTSTSFSTPSGDGKSRTREWYSKTVYGQEYLRLQDVVICPGFQSQPSNY